MLFLFLLTYEMTTDENVNRDVRLNRLNMSLYATSFFYGGIGKCLSVTTTGTLTY